MAEEPLFDPSLKKRSKKKQVAFSEDPLGADADPTVPAPSLDDTIDLGPRTVHEQMKQSEAGADDVPSELKEVREEDDFKAMFGDLKKKKKKKEIPLDLVCPTSPYFFPDDRRLFLTAGRRWLWGIHSNYECTFDHPRCPRGSRLL
jgi:hypothetical protein